MIVCGHRVAQSVIESVGLTLTWRVQPAGRAVTRVWAVEVLGISFADYIGGRVQLTPGSGTPVTVTVGPGTALRQREVVLIETVSKSASLATPSLSAVGLDGAVEIRSVKCWELPRVLLSKDATDLGVDLGSLDPDRPIAARDYESVFAVHEAIRTADGRRGALVSWRGLTVQTSSASYVNCFQLPIRMVPPRVSPSSTSRLCSWDVYAWCDSGTTGDARVVDRSGVASATLPVASTTQSWRGPGTKLFLCEDPGDPNGLPGGSYETVQLQIRRLTGAGNVYVSGLCVWDGPW